MVDALKLAGVAIVAIAVAGCASTPTPPTTAEKAARIKATGWQPGGPTFIPAEVLDLYPCHSAELPCGSLPPPAIEKVAFTGPVKGDPKKGEAIAINIRYGNCIACHDLPNGHKGGTIGPSLADYGKRGATVEYTYQRIWDTRVYNPNAFMPVYGPNAVLNDQEVQDVMAFLATGK
jgi:sulfur-oxidizing protein SoxX